MLTWSWQFSIYGIWEWLFLNPPPWRDFIRKWYHFHILSQESAPFFSQVQKCCKFVERNVSFPWRSPKFQGIVSNAGKNTKNQLFWKMGIFVVIVRTPGERRQKDSDLAYHSPPKPLCCSAKSILRNLLFKSWNFVIFAFSGGKSSVQIYHIK